MKDNFDECLKMLLHHEGGYVNHPKDPGGETNLGVTKRVYEKWGGTKDMKDLTVEDVAPIYKKNYWNRCKCDDLESGVDWVVFDWAVNSGTGRSAKAIQKICGASQDGAIGPKTLALIKTQDTEYVIEEFGKIRQNFYESLKTFNTFGKGWTRRNKETTEKAIKMMEINE
jgi:lysozyme family protein|tara:strand:- start:887 stop:1396 length:510 start_codon:yes stop_codon:yes gene_type:complete